MESLTENIGHIIQSNARELIGRGFVMQSDVDLQTNSKRHSGPYQDKKVESVEMAKSESKRTHVQPPQDKIEKRKPKNKADLKQQILKAWRSINASTTRKLVNFKPRRLQAVI